MLKGRMMPMEKLTLLAEERSTCSISTSTTCISRRYMEVLYHLFVRDTIFVHQKVGVQVEIEHLVKEFQASVT